MEKVGATKLFDANRIAVVLDHIAPAKSEKNAADHAKSRAFVKKYGIEKFYDIDAGIAHLVLMEAGHVRPGDLIVGTDSHCTIYGSLGALGSGIGYTEVTSVWITGKLWMKVPESYRIVCGKFLKGAIQRPHVASHRESRRRWLYVPSVEFYGDRGRLERLRTHDDDEPCHGDGVKCALFHRMRRRANISKPG
jgi:homoaconitase/3-isopropylmalate dehydratase large subunit